jgi:KDO2-lipid IV(A) lauroyltransferase
LSAVSFQYRLEYLAFRVLAWMIGVLPERVALHMCATLGWLGGVVFRIRRSDVDRHLALAFPEQDSAWRARVARDSYRHFAREAGMTLRLSGMDPREVVDRTDMEGFEEFREAVEKGEGAVVVSGHLGNWEIAGASAAARGVPMDVVAHRQKNPLFDDYLVETRRRLGLTVMVKNDGLRLARRSLAEGRVAAFVADQNIRRRGIFVDFFGRSAATPKGPAMFALRSGAPVFLGTAVRLPGWPSRYKVRAERIPVSRDLPVDEAITEITQHYTSLLEQRIREAPEQYFWQHRRWKTRPDSETR